MDHELHKIPSLGGHTSQSTERDIEELVKRVFQTNVSQNVTVRKYQLNIFVALAETLSNI